MNLSVHVISTGILTAIVSRFFGVKNSIGFFCFASFLDVDHYIYYIFKFHKLHVKKAIKYFDSHRHIRRFCLCIFHTVEFLILFSLISYFSRSFFLYACFLGSLLHCVIDIAQGLYYGRMQYRWWSAIGYYRSVNKNNEDNYNKPL